MKLVRSFDEIPFNDRSVITIGTFDGVHLAHKKIIDEVVAKAKENNCRSIIITFDPHPRDIVGRTKGVTTELLTTIEEREELCERYGIEYFLVMKFDDELSKQSFRDFYIKYLVERIGVFMVIEGYDHHWGRDRIGNIELLGIIGKEFNFKVLSVEQMKLGNVTINSSLIRDRLKDGNVEEAEKFLGRPYKLTGKVVTGDRRGKSLGYPTANIKPHSPSKVIPKNGIYFGQIIYGEQAYYGMISIGVRPTFKNDGEKTIEVNIFDFDRDIYGSDLGVNFLHRLRDEYRYNSTQELIQQMNRDKELSRKYEYEIKKQSY